MVGFTPSSSCYSSSDGSIGIGVEVAGTGGLGFQEADKGTPAIAEQTWTLDPPVPAVELYGKICARFMGKTDVLVRIYFDGRLILNWECKKLFAGDCNEWVFVPPMDLQSPATSVKVHIEAAGAGDAWPIECEIELAGRHQ